MNLKGKGIFELVLVAFCVLFFIVSFRYNPRARLAPEVFSFILFFLAGILFLGDNVPFFQKRFKFMHEKGFFTNVQKLEEGDNVHTENKGTKVVNENLKLIRIVLWLVGFAIVLRYVTYLITVPVWLLLFTKFEGDRKWREASYLAIGMGVFNYVIFAWLLKVTF